MSHKLNITLSLAGLPRIPMSIAREEEEQVRRAEDAVNDLWREWSMLFKDRTQAQVLAMTAFRFAQLYLGTLETSKATQTALEDFENELDKLLLGT